MTTPGCGRTRLNPLGRRRKRAIIPLRAPFSMSKNMSIKVKTTQNRISRNHPLRNTKGLNLYVIHARVFSVKRTKETELLKVSKKKIGRINTNGVCLEAHSDKMILDLRRVKLEAQKAEREVRFRFEKSRNIKRLMLITKDGKLFDIRK